MNCRCGVRQQVTVSESTNALFFDDLHHAALAFTLGVCHYQFACVANTWVRCWGVQSCTYILSSICPRSENSLLILLELPCTYWTARSSRMAASWGQRESYTQAIGRSLGRDVWERWAQDCRHWYLVSTAGPTTSHIGGVPEARLGAAPADVFHFAKWFKTHVYAVMCIHFTFLSDS